MQYNSKQFQIISQSILSELCHQFWIQPKMYTPIGALSINIVLRNYSKVTKLMRTKI